MTQEIDIPTWKWDVINIDFITRLPRTRRHHDSIWVIVDRMIKSRCFLEVMTTDLAEPTYNNKNTLVIYQTMQT